MINYGDWQNMPDYRQGWVDKHKNAFGDLLRAADPMTYVPGISSVANPIHDMGDAAVTGINTALSPVISSTNKVLKTITPGVQYMEDNIPMMGNINRFIENKPFDAAALAAATFFSGGAAAGGMSGAPAASGGAGAMGGMASSGAAGSAAITPSFMSGAAAGGGMGAGAAGSTTGALVGANAITPALASGTYGGMAGTAGLGTLGTAGTASGMGAMTPSFMGGAGFMDKARSFMGKANEADKYRRNFSNYGMPDNKDDNRQANALAQKILDSNSVPTTNIKRMADRISMNRWRTR